MSETPEKVSPDTILQILMTEHTNLQSVRSGTTYESTGRTTLFIGTVSSAMVALAFIGQVSNMGTPFLAFALILLPSLLFVGIVTFLRTYQSGIEDMLAGREINRIRHYYTEIAPEVKKYFILSDNDDMPGLLWNMGIPNSPWQQLVSASGLVVVINGILAAAFAGLLCATLLGTTLLISLIACVVVFVINLMACFRYQNARFIQVNSALKVLYPSGQGDPKV